MIDIWNIMDMLDWRMPPEVQAKGISLAKDIESIGLFMQPVTPKYSKNVWENCAFIVESKSDEALKPYLSQLLDWIEDVNWPGALTILERLKNISGEMLKEPFLERFFYAKNLNNEEGFMRLDKLSELLDNADLKQQLSIHFSSIIKIGVFGIMNELYS